MYPLPSSHSGLPASHMGAPCSDVGRCSIANLKRPTKSAGGTVHPQLSPNTLFAVEIADVFFDLEFKFQLRIEW